MYQLQNLISTMFTMLYVRIYCYRTQETPITIFVFGILVENKIRHNPNTKFGLTFASLFMNEHTKYKQHTL